MLFKTFAFASLYSSVLGERLSIVDNIHLSNDDVKSWFTVSKNEPFTTVRNYVEQVSNNVFKQNPKMLHLADHQGANGENWLTKEFQWIPEYKGAVIPGGEPLKWKGKCFQENTATAKFTDDMKAVSIKFTIGNKASLFCMDYNILGAAHSPQIQNFFFSGTHEVTYDLSKARPAEVYDVKVKGIRIMPLRADYITTLKSLANTALMFASELTKSNPEWVSERNIKFLNDYSQIKPFPRKRKKRNIEIDEKEINSGDFFGIRRLDGLDPMLAWAMGATTGHTTIALRINGTLYITESTAKDSYWDVNGIQKTPYKEWIKKAIAAGYSVVHAPLSPKYRKMFDENKALEFFKEVEGYDYGYQAMLWGWIDTEKLNYPCLPPDFKSCLLWEHLEIMIPWVEKVNKNIASLMFIENWNKHVGTENLAAAEVLQKAHEKGMKGFEIHTVVESDSFVYNVKKNGKPSKGPAMVCCVFVCRLWKAAGVFKEINDEVNCGELTNYDIYALNIFDSNRTGANRPKQCIEADPENPLCQLTGDYSLVLNEYNTRDVFSHFGEHCPAQNPFYKRPPRC